MFSNNSCLRNQLITFQFLILTYSETHMALHMVLMSQHSAPLDNAIAGNVIYVMRTNKIEISGELLRERINRYIERMIVSVNAITLII